MKILILFLALNVHAEENLSFSQAYQKALDVSLRIETQKYNVDIAKAQHLKPLGQFTPQISVFAQDLQGGDPHYEQKPVGVQAKMNLFRFGADALQYRSTNLTTKSQQEKLQNEKLGTEEDALAAIFNVIRLSTSLEVYRGISNTRAEVVRIADERYRKGLLAAQEVEKVRVDFENAKAREADTLNDLRDAEAALSAFIGAHWTSNTWPWTDTIKSKQVAQEFRLENIPAYRSAVFDEESAQTFAKSQFRKFLPSLDLEFSYGSNNAENATPTTSLNYYIGTLTLTIPIFDQLDSYSNYRQAESVASQASAQRAYLVRDLMPLFDSAKLKFLNTLDSTLRREKNLSTSRKLYEDNFSRFKQGRVSVNDLLIDQNRLSDAELLAIESWYNLHLDYERLCHASGLSVDGSANCAR